MTLMVEVMQYDGVYDNGWSFPLQALHSADAC